MPDQQRYFLSGVAEKATPDGAEAWVHADGFHVDTARARLDLDAIWDFLGHVYWTEGLPREQVMKSIANSAVFGLYAPDGRQIGFARVVSDYARFAWLSDVYVLEEHRGRGFGSWLVETILGYWRFRDVVRWTLATTQAHGLYEKFGFAPHPDSRRIMVLDLPPKGR